MEEGDGEEKFRAFSVLWAFLWTELQNEFHLLQRSLTWTHSCKIKHKILALTLKNMRNYVVNVQC